jgi:hypothetical protein
LSGVHKIAHQPAGKVMGVIHQTPGSLGRSGRRRHASRHRDSRIAACRRLATEQTFHRIGNFNFTIAQADTDDFNAIGDFWPSATDRNSLGSGRFEGNDNRTPTVLTQLIDKLDRANPTDGLEWRKLARDHQQGARFRHCALLVLQLSAQILEDPHLTFPAVCLRVSQRARLKPTPQGIVAAPG